MKRDTFRIFWYISGHCLLYQILSTASYCLSNSHSLSSSSRRFFKWIHVEVLQSERRVSMTSVFCRDRKRCYLQNHNAKASQRVGKGSQNQFHYISDSHLWRQDLSAVTGWHILNSVYFFFLKHCTIIPWKCCMWESQQIKVIRSLKKYNLLNRIGESYVLYVLNLYVSLSAHVNKF